MNRNRVNVLQFEKVIIVYNPSSGKQVFASMLTRVTELRRTLSEFISAPFGVELTELQEFSAIDKLAEKIKNNGYEWVIIAGGDGTLRAMVERLDKLNYWPYISVFPGGTVNLVGKELDLGVDPSKWIRRVLQGNVVPMRLGRANGEVFLTVAGIGFDSLVVDNVSTIEKRIFSSFAYILQGTEIMRKELLFGNWKYKFRVCFDDSDEWYEAASVIIGKSRYYAGRYRLFEDGAVTNDFFNVALFVRNERADFMKYASMIMMEKLDENEGVIVKKAKKLKIECNVEDFPAELDGDVVTKAPLEIEMHPEILKFLA